MRKYWYLNTIKAESYIHSARNFPDFEHLFLISWRCCFDDRWRTFVKIMNTFLRDSFGSTLWRNCDEFNIIGPLNQQHHLKMIPHHCQLSFYDLPDNSSSFNIQFFFTDALFLALHNIRFKSLILRRYHIYIWNQGYWKINQERLILLFSWQQSLLKTFLHSSVPITDGKVTNY